MNKHHDHTESVIAVRAGLLELVAVAVGIALGVNILAAGVLLIVGWSPWAIVALGTAMIIVGCGYLIARVAPRISRLSSFEGVLPAVGEGHEVIPIDRYEFAEDTARHFRGLAAENRALARAWAENPLSDLSIEKEGRGTARSSPAAKLAREALEYFVLNELSLHLSAHFDNNSRVDDAEIVTVGRRDTPSVLLDNHFLELFSRPMEEREAFSHADMSPTPHKVVYATGEGGEIFDEFELILPRGTQVSRVGPNTILIRTKRFSVRIESVFDGFAANFPTHFEELYLGRRFTEVDAYQINLKIGVHFSLVSLFTGKGWEYYHWLDSFLDDIERKFSFEQFLQSIGWEAALSSAMLARRLTESTSKIATVQPER